MDKRPQKYTKAELDAISESDGEVFILGMRKDDEEIPTIETPLDQHVNDEWQAIMDRHKRDRDEECERNSLYRLLHGHGIDSDSELASELAQQQ